MREEVGLRLMCYTCDRTVGMREHTTTNLAKALRKEMISSSPFGQVFRATTASSERYRTPWQLRVACSANTGSADEMVLAVLHCPLCSPGNEPQRKLMSTHLYIGRCLMLGLIEAESFCKEKKLK